MTLEGAKKELKILREDYWDEYGDTMPALDMAIKVLEQEPCEDAISRAEAVRVASGYCHPSNIAKELAKLPSVQPKYNASEWCHDCKEYDHDKHCCPRFNKVIRNAVEEVKKPKTGHCKDCKYFEYDHFENMGGIPLITAHKVCKRHGLIICKTDEDGYCHLWEHKAESEVQDAGSN